MSRAWEKGSTAKWRALRLVILKRDNYRCQIRLPVVCTTKATHVHHILGRAVSGDNPEHLQAACAPCNIKTGDPARLDPKPKKGTHW